MTCFTRYLVSPPAMKYLLVIRNVHEYVLFLYEMSCCSLELLNWIGMLALK